MSAELEASMRRHPAGSRLVDRDQLPVIEHPTGHVIPGPWLTRDGAEVIPVVDVEWKRPHVGGPYEDLTGLAIVYERRPIQPEPLTPGDLRRLICRAYGVQPWQIGLEPRPRPVDPRPRPVDRARRERVDRAMRTRARRADRRRRIAARRDYRARRAAPWYAIRDAGLDAGRAAETLRAAVAGAR